VPASFLPRVERPGGFRSERSRFALLTLAIAVASAGAACSYGPLRPEPDALNRAMPQLVERLRTDPFTYFRFVNRPWVARVCDVFEGDLGDVPIVRLHGDAHLEQFAFTNDAWGLDDFDDSARGPAIVDIVRFLGSIDVAVRQRGWLPERAALFDRFFEGYRRGLAQDGFQPPEPDIVRRLRTQTPSTRQAFLARGESQMQPMTDDAMNAVVAGMEIFSRLLRDEKPDLPPDYFRVMRAGWLRMGVGSAVDEKILVRVQGPTTDPDDDELLEGKVVRNLSGLACLEGRSNPPTLRVITGSRQLGRLKHNILADAPALLLPEILTGGEPLRDWWIRSWDPSYGEIRLSDLASVDDLQAIVLDSGAQLGAGNLERESGEPAEAIRQRSLASLARLEGRLRREATALVDDVLRGWEELR
jgi:hypothetical protein